VSRATHACTWGYSCVQEVPYTLFTAGDCVDLGNNETVTGLAELRSTICRTQVAAPSKVAHKDSASNRHTHRQTTQSVSSSCAMLSSPLV
jgi:hypothetical protein